jgi:hypothetical protein
MWYSASLLFRSVSPNRSDNDLLWEESIVLFEASSKEDAYERATTAGKAEQHGYITATGDELNWVFESVASVYEIGDGLCPGTELFSRFLRASEAASLLTPFDD